MFDMGQVPCNSGYGYVDHEYFKKNKEEMLEMIEELKIEEMKAEAEEDFDAMGKSTYYFKISTIDGSHQKVS